MNEKLDPDTEESKEIADYYPENDHVYDNTKTNEENIQNLYTTLINEAGQDGRHQKFLFVICCLGAFICCLFLTVFPLQKDLPDYYCIDKMDYEYDVAITRANKEEEEYLTFDRSRIDLNRYKVVSEHHCVERFCNYEGNNKKVNPYETLLIIDNWSKINFITELGVMCEMENYFGLMMQMLFLGKIIGNVIFSYIADKYGRYICFLIELGIIFLSYVIFLIFKTKVVYLVLSFILSMCLHLYIHISVMSTEIMSQPMYSLLNGLIGASFTFCGMVNILVMFFMKNWIFLIYLHLTLSLILIYLIKNYLTETPAFLFDQKDYPTLTEVIKKISRNNGNFNKLESRLRILDQYKNVKSLKIKNDNLNNSIQQKNDNKNDKEVSFVQNVFGPYLLIFNSQKNLIQLIKLINLYICVNLVFYGQILNIEKMSGNMFFNSFIIYIGEIIAEFMSGFILQNFGRKPLIIACYSFSAFFCGSVYLLEINDAFPFIKLVFIFSNSFFISIAFVVNYVYTAEVFDTNVKSTASSLLNSLGNLFMLISPYLISLFKSPFGVFAVISGMAALNGFILKETKKESET